MLNAIKKIVGSESGTNARTTPPTSTRTTTATAMQKCGQIAHILISQKPKAIYDKPKAIKN